jgi:hypothetical protein
MMIAMWRGTVLILEDIVECLTVGTCCGNANIAGGKSESKFDKIGAIPAVVSAVLSGVLAVGGSAVRTANGTASFCADCRDRVTE